MWELIIHTATVLLLFFFSFFAKVFLYLLLFACALEIYVNA